MGNKQYNRKGDTKKKFIMERGDKKNAKMDDSLPHVPDKKTILDFARTCKDSRLLILYCLQIFLGLRIGSALNLRWIHVDLDKKGVFILDDKKTNRYKTGYGKDRPLPIRDSFVPILRMWQQLNKNEPYVIPRGNSKAEDKNWEIMFEMMYAKHYESIGKKIIWRTGKNGYPRYIYKSHTGRHIFGTNFLLNAGNTGLIDNSVILLRDLMGHSNIEQTLVYVHLCNQMRRIAVNMNYDTQLPNKSPVQVVLNIQSEQVPLVMQYLNNQKQIVVMQNGNLSQ